MATDTSGITGNALINSLNSGQQETKKTNKNGEVSKEQFLQLLVTQLKNQDPLDPMKNDQFAVDLAQFSQLEQLMDINKKVGKSSAGGDFSSMVAYLGNEVTLNSNEIEVSNGSAGKASFELVGDVRNATLQILDKAGAVVEEKQLGDVKAGKHSVALQGLSVPNGDYTMKLSATTLGGTPRDIEVRAAGVVSGFVPGDDPSLMIGNREVKLTDIKQVNLAS